eukprot:11517284-Prorocentrum_lima.AAC.1
MFGSRARMLTSHFTCETEYRVAERHIASPRSTLDCDRKQRNCWFCASRKKRNEVTETEVGLDLQFDS